MKMNSKICQALKLKKIHRDATFKSENQESDEIVFYDNVYYFMKESTDEFIEIFVSTEFNKFLHNHKPLQNEEKSLTIL